MGNIITGNDKANASSFVLAQWFEVTDKGVAAPACVGIISLAISIIVAIGRAHGGQTQTDIADWMKPLSTISLIVVGVWQFGFACARYGWSDLGGLAANLIFTGTASLTTYTCAYCFILFAVEMCVHGDSAVLAPPGVEVAGGFGFFSPLVIFFVLIGIGIVFQPACSGALRYARSVFIFTVGLCAVAIASAYHSKNSEYGFGAVSITWFFVTLLILVVPNFLAICFELFGMSNWFSEAVFRKVRDNGGVNTKEDAAIACIPLWFTFMLLGVVAAHVEVFGCDPDVAVHPNSKAMKAANAHCAALSEAWLWIIVALTALGGAALVSTAALGLVKSGSKSDGAPVYLGSKTPTFTSTKRDGDNNASYATVATGDDCDADDAVVTTPLKQREPHFRV